MVAAKPKLCDIGKTMVLCNLLGIEVTMVINDGQMCRMVMIKLLRRRCLQQEVCVHKRFHVDYVFKVYYMAKALKPPSTTATVPVTKLEASLIR